MSNRFHVSQTGKIPKYSKRLKAHMPTVSFTVKTRYSSFHYWNQLNVFQSFTRQRRCDHSKPVLHQSQTNSYRLFAESYRILSERYQLSTHKKLQHRYHSEYGVVNQIEIFIHGIAHQIRNKTTWYWSYHPDIDLESLSGFANGLHYAIYRDKNDKISNYNWGYCSGCSKLTRTSPSSSIVVETSVLQIHHNEQQVPLSH